MSSLPPSPSPEAPASPGPDRKWKDSPWPSMAVAATILAGSGAGCYFILWQVDPLPLRVALLLCCVLFTLLSLLSLLALCVLDPGVVIPSPHVDPIILQAQAGNPSPDLFQDRLGQWARVEPVGPTYAPPKDLEGAEEGGGDSRASMVTERYCRTCNVWRDPRTSHCSTCGFCMRRLDHHCGALGVCVARNNHRFFFSFLIATSLMALCLVLGAVALFHNIDWSSGGFGNQRWQTYVALGLGLVALYTSFLSVFAAFHCCLLLSDTTTKEYVTSSGIHSVQARPSTFFPRGCSNTVAALWRAPLRTKGQLMEEIARAAREQQSREQQEQGP